MAGKVLCEATYLYNVLNQYTRQSRLVESNYLCLIGCSLRRSHMQPMIWRLHTSSLMTYAACKCVLQRLQPSDRETVFKLIYLHTRAHDARPAESFNFSHIITARNAKWDSEGKFIMPIDVEIESMRHIIVYDSRTQSLLDSGPAIDCADSLEKASRFPIQILTGGYEKFSPVYPFLRTHKILYTIREMESLKLYPVEILPGQLYMGDYKQAMNPQILKDLKVKALVNISDDGSLMFEKASCTVLHIRILDSAEADLFISIERICAFIDSHFSTASSVIIFSTYGISRCSAVAMAYLMHHLKYTLKEVWNHIKRCKANMRPNRGFVQQLSDWELQTLGERVTDISEPNY